MLIEKLIEFELRGSGPPGRTCTSTTDKTKIFKEYLRENYFITTGKILQKAMYLTLLYLGQITYKILPRNARL